MTLLQRLQQYLQYRWQAKGRHGVHSPFVFSFINKVLRNRRRQPSCKPLEKLKRQLERDYTLIDNVDMGAGSQGNKPKQVQLSYIARNAVIRRKYGRLLFRMVAYFQPKNILEIGSSLGFGTGYMALGNPNARVLTLEGNPAVSAKAREHWQQLGIGNIGLMEGHFDDTLPRALVQMPAVDMVFMDGNHRYAPTLQYFEALLPHLHNSSLVVVDDIRWSDEMWQAWQELIERDEVSISIDLFQMGVLFFRQGVRKQHFVLKY